MNLYDFNIQAHTESIEVTTMLPPYVKDETWTETDANGHAHSWAEETWDTITQEWFDEDGDEHYDKWYACKQCGASVTPRYKQDPKWVPGVRQFIPGMTTFEWSGVTTDPLTYREWFPHVQTLKGAVLEAELMVTNIRSDGTTSWLSGEARNVVYRKT